MQIVCKHSIKQEPEVMKILMSLSFLKIFSLENNKLLPFLEGTLSKINHYPVVSLSNKDYIS